MRDVGANPERVAIHLGDRRWHSTELKKSKNGGNDSIRVTATLRTGARTGHFALDDRHMPWRDGRTNR